MQTLSYLAAPVMGLVLTLGLASPAAAQDAQPPYLHVTGEGRVSAAPDMATIRLGVEAEAVSPSEAVDAMAAPMSDLLEQLAEDGVEAADIQTSTLSLRPVYANRDQPLEEGPRITGYTASSTVTVSVRALDDLSAVLDGAVGAGTNRLDGLSYGLLDPAPVRDAALAAAVEDGLRKAAVLAEAAGLTIGAPLAVVEQGGSRPPGPVMMEMASMDRSIPTAPGSLEVTAQVELRFAIRP